MKSTVYRLYIIIHKDVKYMSHSKYYELIIVSFKTKLETRIAYLTYGFSKYL